MRKTAAILALAFATTMAWGQRNNDNYRVDQSGTQRITNGPVIEYTSDHSAMIAWSTKFPAGTYIAYGRNQSDLSQRSEKQWGGTNHRIEIGNLRPNTTYYFQIRSEDAKGSGAMGADVESRVASFTTVPRGAAPDRANRDVGVNGSNDNYNRRHDDDSYNRHDNGNYNHNDNNNYGYAGANNNGSLQITRAWYGVGGQSRDVTSALNSQIHGDHLNMVVNNDTMGGDPATGQLKTLTVQYVSHGQTNQVQVREGGMLNLR